MVYWYILVKGRICGLVYLFHYLKGPYIFFFYTLNYVYGENLEKLKIRRDKG